ncbi:MAG: hypothetical protein H6Q33_1980 [Deltaproteobacteria bacterium]|nr:hypothetical protein [Deltaproteobacteria bacterium]
MMSTRLPAATSVNPVVGDKTALVANRKMPPLTALDRLLSTWYGEDRVCR